MFPYIYSRKSTRFLKKYNKIHENLQVTYKIFENKNLHTTKIIIIHIHLENNLNIIHIQCVNLEQMTRKTLNSHQNYKNDEILTKQYRKSN